MELAELVETTEMNKAALRLYRIEDTPAPRQVLAKILVPNDCLHFADQLAAFTSGLDWYEGSGLNQDSSGKSLHVLIKKVVINRAQNGLAKVLSAVNDVTELYRMNELKNSLEDQLRQSQKMEAIGTLAGGISHDFNNILTSIIGYSELALLSLSADSEAYKNISQVIASGNRASVLVRQILTFSRKEKTRLLVIEPHLVVKDALKMLSSMLPATVSIETEIDSGCGQVKADPTQLYQIVTNLCTNAFQAMDKEKGVLRVALRRRELEQREAPVASGGFAGSFVVLSVTDNGCGMDEATRERIFEPYFTTKEQGQGTGLGLAVVHGIVESYGGFIEVTSELGQGTSFDVYFPLYEAPVTAETPSTVFREKSLPRGAEKILLVDDEETIVLLQETILKRLGYEVVATTQARNALAMIQADPESFALLITDQSMPFLTGEELAREVAKIRPSLPVILCTGYSSVLSEKEALAGGVIRKIFKKPLSLHELAVGVRQVLDNPEGSPPEPLIVER
ncbi:MAG: response regulator [Deltaproteobacteria bacterium]|nr:response regulator [Candidatus Anaeroferrophillacea bacterium]